MKTLLKFTFLFITCCGLMMSCSKDESFFGETGELGLKKAANSPVFIVEPSGSDDTPAILLAFENAKAEGPGSVIQLCEGEYHVGMMEILDFYGVLKGAGKDKTIITAMNNLDLDFFMDRNLYPNLIKFVGGDVLICNLTMQTPPGIISTGGPGFGHVTSLLNFSAGNADYELLNEYRSINVVVDHVSFKGQYLEGGAGFYHHTYNCAYAIRAGYDVLSAVVNSVPREKINIKITNSEFDTFIYGIVIEGLKHSKVVIGEKNEGNVFNNLEQCGGVWESRGMDILVEGNTLNIPKLCWGFDQSDYPYYPLLMNEAETTTTTCNIQNNVFNLTYADYGIYLRNQRHFLNPGEKPVAYQIRNNQFNMTDGYPWGILTQVTKDMVIRNNKFSGYGYQALNLTLYSEGGLVLGNNFSKAQFSSAAICLDANTSNWTVVGGNLKDRVINLGENNVITGMNVSTSEIPLGRSISDKLTRMNHLMH